MKELYINPDIEQAFTLPSSFYTSPSYFEVSKEKIFAKTWQFCMGMEALSSASQIVPFTLLPGMLDEPILFVRDTNKVLHCLSNVCTHRGNLLVDEPCTSQHLLCRYHGRRFSLCGDFVHMPAFEGAKNFPSTKDHLPKVPFAELHPFLFASIAPSVPFKEVFQDILSRLFWLPFDKLWFDAKRSRDYIVNSHWALYCENYLEGLHIPFIHRSLRRVLDFTAYSTELYRYANLQLALASEGEEGFDLPPESQDYGKSVAAYYYWIFPNTMLNFYPWGCSVNVIKPLEMGLTKVSFLTFVLDESKMNQGAGAELDRVEKEDEAVVESVQKGIRSRFYDTGRYSPSMETGTHHFHRLLCEFLND
jgi:choline monooxygenase